MGFEPMSMGLQSAYWDLLSLALSLPGAVCCHHLSHLGQSLPFSGALRFREVQELTHCHTAGKDRAGAIMPQIPTLISSTSPSLHAAYQQFLAVPKTYLLLQV